MNSAQQKLESQILQVQGAQSHQDMPAATPSCLIIRWQLSDKSHLVGLHLVGVQALQRRGVGQRRGRLRGLLGPEGVRGAVLVRPGRVVLEGLLPGVLLVRPLAAAAAAAAAGGGVEIGGGGAPPEPVPERAHGAQAGGPSQAARRAVTPCGAARLGTFTRGSGSLGGSL